MAQIKIDIVARAQVAVQELEKLNDTLSKSSTTLSQARKNLIAEGNSVDENSKAWKEYNSVLQRVILGYKAANSDGDAARKTIKAINNEMSKLIAGGAGSKSITLLGDSFVEQNEKASEVLSKIEQETAKAKRSTEDYRIEMESMLGNSLPKLRKELKAKEAALLELVKAEQGTGDRAQKLTKDIKNLRAEMQKASASTTPFTVRISNLLKSFVSAQAILWGVRASFRFVTNTLKDSAEAASKAEETLNLFKETFKDVELAAISTANAMSEKFGTATSTMQQALGTFGDLIKGYGGSDRQALDFAQVAASTTMDIVSFKNISGDLNEIYGNIASGLAGNVENFRRLGYVMTQAEVKTRLQKKGLDGLTGSALQLAQVQERLNILVEKSANAQGDLVRTMDSTENVNRRLTEAWKEYKENLGEDVNAIFTPIKKWFLDILEAQNKLNEAQKEYQKEASEIQPLYSLSDPDAYKNFEQLTISFKRGIWTLDEYVKSMQLYGATLEDVNRILDNQVSNTWLYGTSQQEINNLKDSIKLAFDRVKAEKKAKEEQEKRLSLLKEELQVSNSFIDNLANLKGISVSPISIAEESLDIWSQSEDGTKRGTKAILNDEMGAIKSVISQLETGLEQFSSVIEVNLGKLTKGDMLGNKQSVVADAYEAIYNEFLSNDGSISQVEKSKLNEIIAIYNDIGTELKEIADEEARIKNLGSSMESIGTQIASIQNSIELNKLLANIPEGILADNKRGRITELYNADQLYKSALPNVTTPEERQKLEDAINGLKAVINEKYDQSAKSIMRDSKAEEDARIKKEFAAQMQELRNSFADTFGELSLLIPALGDLSENTMSWKEYLIGLAGELEVVQSLSSLLSDSILPALNSFLSPVTDMLGSLTSLLGNLLTTILDPLYGLMVSIFGSLDKLLSSILDPLMELVEIALAPLEGLLDPIAVLLTTITSMLQPLFQLISPFAIYFEVLGLILEPLKPIIVLLAEAFKYLGAGITYVSTVVKIFVGNIVTFFTGMVNKVIEVLQSINIFGWRPFGGLRKIDDSKYQEWKNLDPKEEMEKYLKNIEESTNKIYDESCDINQNTQKDDKKDLIKQLNDLYKSGLISQGTYAGKLAELTGKKFDATHYTNGGYYYNTASGITYAKGSVVINVSGENQDANAIARKIAEILARQNTPGGSSYGIYGGLA